MTKKLRLVSLAFALSSISSPFLHARPGRAAQATITVEVDRPGHAIPPTLFGAFLEDINLSTDGGLYPELVRNRSFEDAETPQYWTFTSADGRSAASVSTADVQARPPVPPLTPLNRKCLCVKADGSFALQNDGYWGMSVVQGGSYSFRVAARATDGFSARLRIRLVGSDGTELASSEIGGFDAAWRYYTAQLTSSGTDPRAHLDISGEGNGRLYLDMVSLMPDRTWKGHGLRVDIAEALRALRPTFLRFPGGCWVEGDDFAHMNNWKKTIGDIDTRSPLWNIWGYNASNGLGYHEYLQLAEDLGAEPVFCINAGISHKEVTPLDQMGPWLQDALDAIEYANGPETSVWGALRVKNGHPQPFNLKYIEIGNENGQAPYAERWALFTNAIRRTYPGVTLIANDWAGSHPQDPTPQIVDEHYYNTPEWFIWNANMYDDYDRKGPKVFVGEYAVTENTGAGNLRGAIGEAAWMTGMERNSDVVVMGSYAPLFCNANHKRWPVNLINFDSSRWFGLPSYYVQQMFAGNQGSVSLPVKVENGPAIEAPHPAGRIGLGTWNNAAEFKDLLVVSPDGRVLFEADFSKPIDGWTKIGSGEWAVERGVLRQSAIAPHVTAFVGDASWRDYTISLKARKLSGENGFQVYFHNRGDRERLRWDLGGFNDSVHLMEIGIRSQSIPASIESGRWYDVRIEIRGGSVKGYLDGKLVQEVAGPRANVDGLLASAAHDEESGDVIVKIVNAAASPIRALVNLKGAGALSGSGMAIVLASASPLDENTLDEPAKVSPKTETVRFSGRSLVRVFPGNSLTVIRAATSAGGARSAGAAQRLAPSGARRQAK